jgi:hypothetical protein
MRQEWGLLPVTSYHTTRYIGLYESEALDRTANQPGRIWSVPAIRSGMGLSTTDWETGPTAYAEETLLCPPTYLGRSTRGKRSRMGDPGRGHHPLQRSANR